MLQPLHPMVLKWKGIKWCYQVPSKKYNPSLSYLSSMPWPLWGAGSVVATRHTAMASRNRSVGITGWKTKPSLWYRWGQNCAWSKYCKILLNIADMQKPTYPCKVSAICCIYHSSFLNNLVYTFYHFCAELLGSFKSLGAMTMMKKYENVRPLTLNHFSGHQSMPPWPLLTELESQVWRRVCALPPTQILPGTNEIDLSWPFISFFMVSSCFFCNIP